MIAGCYRPISANFVGSSDTISSLDRKLLMALKACGWEIKSIRRNVILELHIYTSFDHIWLWWWGILAAWLTSRKIQPPPPRSPCWVKQHLLVTILICCLWYSVEQMCECCQHQQQNLLVPGPWHSCQGQRLECTGWEGCVRQFLSHCKNCVWRRSPILQRTAKLEKGL